MKYTLILLLLLSTSMAFGQDEYRIIMKSSQPFFEQNEEGANFGKGPGPQELAYGDKEAGLFGEVSSSELFSGFELGNEMGLNNMTALHNNAGWFKFVYEGKTLFIAKKDLLYKISWTELKDVNAVYGGSDAATVSKNENKYIVRLMDGFKGTDIASYSGTGRLNDPNEAKDGEWTKLIYKIHQDVPPNQDGSNWKNYNNSQVNINNGQRSWLQESASFDGTYKISSGYYQLDDFRPIRQGRTAGFDGWRPVLELQ